MNHLKQIAEKLPEYGLDAMLITSEAGERYAIGFHGEGLLLITREETHYTTDGRYIEAAQEQVQGADVKLVTRDSSHLAQARAFLEEPGAALHPHPRPAAAGRPARQQGRGGAGGDAPCPGDHRRGL